MELIINGKKYSFKFGIRFVKELNKVAGMETKGMKFGMALQTTLPALQALDPSALADVLYAANVTESPRLSQKEVDDYLESDVDLEEVFNDIVKEIANSNATRLVAKKMKLGK